MPDSSAPPGARAVPTTPSPLRPLPLLKTPPSPAAGRSIARSSSRSRRRRPAASRPLRGKMTHACATCDGAGHQVLGGNCAQCGGSGAVAKRSFFGWPGGMSECVARHGGGIAQRSCPDCEGAGTQLHAPIRSRSASRPGCVTATCCTSTAGARVPIRRRPTWSFASSCWPTPSSNSTRTARCAARCRSDGFAWIANRTVQLPTLAGPAVPGLAPRPAELSPAGRGLSDGARRCARRPGGHGAAGVSGAAQR